MKGRQGDFCAWAGDSPEQFPTPHFQRFLEKKLLQFGAFDATPLT